MLQHKSRPELPFSTAKPLSPRPALCSRGWRKMPPRLVQGDARIHLGFGQRRASQSFWVSRLLAKVLQKGCALTLSKHTHKWYQKCIPSTTMCIYIYIYILINYDIIYIYINVCVHVCVCIYVYYVYVYYCLFIHKHILCSPTCYTKKTCAEKSCCSLGFTVASDRRSSDQVLLSCHSWTSCLCTSPAKLHAARCRHRGHRCRVVDSTAFRGAVPKTRRSDSHRQIVVPKIMKNDDWWRLECHLM